MNVVSVNSAGITNRGNVREENQDQFIIAELSRALSVKASGLPVADGTRLVGNPFATLLLVADGMGGHLGGKEASKLAIEYFLNSILNKLAWLESITSNDEQSFKNVLGVTLIQAHRELQLLAETSPDLKDMGTTLTLACVAWPHLHVVHAGDTRCYLSRNQELRLLTRDHTVAQQMLLNGELKPEEQERSPWSNVLVNALGAGAPEVVPDFYHLRLESGDRLMLCSDGLNKHVSDDRIARELCGRKNPEMTAQVLVQLALDGGGTDNVTVLVADFQDSTEPKTMRTFSEIPTEQKLMSEIVLAAGDIDTTEAITGQAGADDLTLDE
ncbi:PP2C family protein-serine/threonine phosphatase [Pirellulaceae bacterium SH449]